MRESVFFFYLLLVVGCSMESNNDDIINENFTIGIIGSEPTVQLKNVNFIETDLENIP
jgi:hypothetical protein